MQSQEFIISMTKAQLDIEIERHAEDIFQKWYTGQQKRRQNAPYIVSACSPSTGHPECVIDENRHPSQDEYLQVLKDRFFQRLGGGIGDNTQYANWKIGSCAEQHAANRALYLGRHYNIDDLVFSKAMCCKIPISVAPCGNCSASFDQL